MYHISYYICILSHTFSSHKKSLLSCIFFRFTVRTVSRTTSDFARRMGRSSATNSCHHYSTRQKKNRGSLCFLMFFSKFGRIQRSKICKLMLHDLSHPHLQNIKQLHSDLPSHLDVQHSCLFARHQSLSDRPIVCHFSRAFSPTRHRFGTSPLAGALAVCFWSRFVCKDAENVMEISEKKSARTWANLKIQFGILAKGM